MAQGICLQRDKQGTEGRKGFACLGNDMHLAFWFIHAVIPDEAHETYDMRNAQGHARTANEIVAADAE